jgi:hypothetical protein
LDAINWERAWLADALAGVVVAVSRSGLKQLVAEIRFRAGRARTDSLSN